MLIMGIASDDGHGKEHALNAAEDHFLLVKIIVPCRNVNVAVYVDLYKSMVGSISCNGAEKRVPGGVVRNLYLASGSV